MQRALAGRLSKAQACTCEHAARLRLPAPRVSVQSTRFARRGCTLALQPQRRRPAQQRAARLHAVNKVDSLNTEQLEVAIQERDRPLIVDFYANWCGPCVLLAKELEQARPCALVCAQHTVAAELGDAVRIVKVDVDQEQALASHLQIQGLPTLVFIGMDKAKPALRLEGLLPADAIKDVLKDLTAPMVGA